jgi:hypothetical protein
MNDNGQIAQESTDTGAREFIGPDAAEAAARYQQEIAAAAGRPMFSPTGPVVDTAALAKAQGRFIKEQTRFLLLNYQYGSTEFTEALGVYGRAQTDYIDALQTALHQAGYI